jgi:hypothetical protein
METLEQRVRNYKAKEKPPALDRKKGAKVVTAAFNGTLVPKILARNGSIVDVDAEAQNGSYRITLCVTAADAVFCDRIVTPAGSVLDMPFAVRGACGEEVAQAILDFCKSHDKDDPEVEVVKVYRVYCNKRPVGQYLNQGQGKRGLSFPVELRGECTGFLTEKEAERYAKKFKDYLADLKALPPSKKKRKKR